MKTTDVIVIGGGLSGSATALGLVKEKAGKVLMFDSQLPSQRLSRANFGLTWFMCKGGSSSAYAKWCRNACAQWPEYAATLEDETNINVELEWTGGALHAFGEEQWNAHAASIEKLSGICAEEGLDYPVSMLSRQEFAELVPKMQLGEDVSGAMYTPQQGHVNPLKVLAAMRKSFQQLGGEFVGNQNILEIIPNGDSVTVKTKDEEYSCHKLVVAAGHGCTRLLFPLGYKLNVYPQRGQLLVTERCERKLPFPLLAVRQTQDGTYMIGLSTEDVAHDTNITPQAMQQQAQNAIRIFPELAKVNWVRAWGAIRVMTPDGIPVYDRLEQHPNIYVMALHSALSLNPLHTSVVAPWILDGSNSEIISSFSNGRFNV
ncbi:FAD-dependent oxidoreductase [Halodesulfovibrio sp.]|uniref:NAD(P)/FAD-dependent oxidoreductase n=1 Tax=Halodesulfovibrio sp. TaxID=1912772 RepID=UPI0025FE50D5|nr:FAD-dependent oxidoreductase [Halodesulfovibrio sp.]MCT4535536.1 FAD-binding oxidoreductase [Halodesulfovibrio sp.]MCT4626519.1 FAD-binding oxidoreductase [Halodesulfovibrio sp.]